MIRTFDEMSTPELKAYARQTHSTIGKLEKREELLRALTKVCRHLGQEEIGMVGYYEGTEDCGFGCKVVRCDRCGTVEESHRSVYGCPLGRGFVRKER